MRSRDPMIRTKSTKFAQEKEMARRHREGRHEGKQTKFAATCALCEKEIGRNDLPLARVKRTAGRRERSNTEWQDAIRDAVETGCSLRAVADAAGISHVRVLQITRDA